MERHEVEQAQIFGEDPGLYDRFRPSYPRELMEVIVADSGDSPVLEIGAGTGKATRALVALGKRVYALEPDVRMAALLEGACGSGLDALQHVTLELSILPPEAFDLVVAAQSWHWVDPMVGYDIVARSMVSNGRLALLWHHPLPQQGLFGEAMDQLYAKLAPNVAHIWPGTRARNFDPALEPISASQRFDGWTRHEHQWSRKVDAPELIGWLCSTSEHRLLSLDQRLELMSGVAALVAEFHGEVSVAMSTVAHIAFRTGD